MRSTSATARTAAALRRHTTTVSKGVRGISPQRVPRIQYHCNTMYGFTASAVQLYESCIQLLVFCACILL